MPEEDSVTTGKSERSPDLQGLREEIITMLAQQRAGDFEAVIPLEKLRGDEKDIGAAFNELSQIHVGNILSMLEVVSAYADGDFSPVLKRLPGKQVYANEKMDLLRKNLRSLNEDMEFLTKGAFEGRLDIRVDATRHIGDYRKIIDGVNTTLDAFIGPFNVAAEYMERISEGDVPQKITEQYRGDFNEIKNNLNQLIDVIILRGQDIDMLTNAGLEGRLDTRGDTSKYHGYHGGMIDKINKMLDAYIGPFNVSAEYIERISEGDVPQKITEQYRGDFNEIKNNLNKLIDVVNMRNADIQLLINAATEGKLDVRADSTKYNGLNGKMINGINAILDAFIGPFNVSAEYIERISEGDIPQKITDNYRGDFNEIKNNLNKLIDVVNMRNADVQLLISAATEGKLDVRADSTKYHGLNGKMIDGINAMLDTFIGPFNVSAEYIERISEGDVPQKITDNYKGDFNEIKNNLNKLIDVVNMRNADVQLLISAATEGKLDVRADSTKYHGLNGKMIDGINAMLDTFIGPFNVSAEYIERISEGDVPQKITDTYKGDFNEIKNNLNKLIDVVNMRNADVQLLISAATEGKLDVRADSTKYHGLNGKMIEGINAMLDTFIGPFNVSAEYIERISEGDVPQKITDNYKGDFNEIKNNLNKLIDVVNMRNGDIQLLINAATEGKLDVRADSTKYHGLNGKMIDGINAMLDAFIGPLNVAAEYVDRISKGDIPKHITDNYKGDFNEIKNNLNQCINAINLLIEDTQNLASAAKRGDLDKKADKSRHLGKFAEIVNGINETLDWVVIPLHEGMRICNEYSQCNLTSHFDEHIKVEGEFKRFKESLDRIGDGISSTIHSLKQEIISLAKNADTAHVGVSDVSRGAHEIAKNADEVSRNAEKSEDGINQVLRAMADLTTTVSAVSQNADAVARLSLDANNLAMEGSKHAGDAETGMISITKSSHEIETIVKEIKSEMDKIGKIVGIITDLANQTNLLALNAAIEAARAGDAGRGFAVVASEVKSLAQESRVSAESISDMISGLQKKTDSAANAMENAGKAVNEGNSALSDTLKAFTHLTQSVDTINQNMVSVASATEEQAASFEEITASVNEMSVLVKKTADDALHSSATSEEALAVVDQIIDIIKKINEAVDVMNKEVTKFKLR